MDNTNLALPPKDLAHQLAMLWVEAVLSDKRQPITKNLSVVEEYLAAYNGALEKLGG